MIYTSYFSKYKGSNGVAITLGANWWKGETYKELAPNKELLMWWKSIDEHDRNSDVYQSRYINVYVKYILSKLDVDKVAKELDGKVLLCFEKSEDFCHRHIVSQWLRDNGYECIELP